MENKHPKSNALRAFFMGFAAAFDISGGVVLKECSDPASGWKRDGEAIRGDWQRVGNDMRRAMNIVANER
jgi:hypothetical protein